VVAQMRKDADKREDIFREAVEIIKKAKK